jgi:hypothetical protein
MVYAITFLLCGLGYFAFILSVDPQFMPPSIRVGMAVTFFCLAIVVCAGWYILKRLSEQLKNDTERRDEIDL